MGSQYRTSSGGHMMVAAVPHSTAGMAALFSDVWGQTAMTPRAGGQGAGG